MYGYVRPRRDRMTPAAEQAYKAAYCGLCRTLGVRYGLTARFAVSYDMTFLYLLLTSGAGEGETRDCFCPARPFCRQRCLTADRTMETVAAIDLILLSWQLADHMRDERLFRRIGFRIAGAFLHRAFRKAAAELPAFSTHTQARLRELWDLEENASPSLDRTAHCFADILRGCAFALTQEPDRRAAEEVLYHVGRFIYLTDCVDDLAEDVRKNRYNPLRYRFSLADGALSETDRVEVRSLIEHSISRAGAAFELLSTGANTPIVENVIYYGLPAVLHGAFSGEFKRTKKMDL